MESEEESDSGMASLALASAYVTKSIFNTEDNGLVTDTDANDEDDSSHLLLHGTWCQGKLTRCLLSNNKRR